MIVWCTRYHDCALEQGQSIDVLSLTSVVVYIIMCLYRIMCSGHTCAGTQKTIIAVVISISLIILLFVSGKLQPCRFV